MAQYQEIKKQILMKFLDKGAYERLGRVRIANAMLAEQVEMYLIQLYQTGQMKEMLTEEKLKQILNLIVQKHETKIVRR